MSDATVPGGPSLGTFRFAKARRLRSRREILAVQGKGSRVHTAHFVLIVGPGPTSVGASRLGITVTRKIGDAVRRNRVKRVVREAFRLDPSLLPAGIDLLVIAKAGAPTLGLAEVQAEWGTARNVLQRKAREALARPTTAHVAKPAR